MSLKRVSGLVFLLGCISNSRTEGLTNPSDPSEVPCSSLSTEHEELCFRLSPINQKQMVVVNTSAEVALVMDTNNNQFAVLSGDGEGVIYDENKHLAFRTTVGVWKSNVVTYSTEMNIPNLIATMVPVDTSSIEHYSDFDEFLTKSLSNFGSELRDFIIRKKSHILSVVKTIFSRIMKSKLGPIIDFDLNGWYLIKRGLIPILNTFRWMGRFADEVTGGLPSLTKSAVKFSLKKVLKAINQEKLFLYLLTKVGQKLSLSTAIPTIITHPSRIALAVYALGGQNSGVSGLFKVLVRTLGLINMVVNTSTESLGYHVLSSTRKLTTTIAAYISNQPTQSEISIYADHMLAVADTQDILYHNRAEIQIYIDFWKASKGEGTLPDHGVNIGSIIKELLKDTHSTGTDTTIAILNSLKVVVPLNVTLSTFVLDMIINVRSWKGLGVVKALMPDVEIPDEPLGPTMNRELALPADDPSTTAELVEKFPLARRIVGRIQQSVAMFDNVSIKSILNEHTPITVSLKNTLLSYGSF